MVSGCPRIATELSCFVKVQLIPLQVYPNTFEDEYPIQQNDTIENTKTDTKL